jgi:hypothetical protein
MTKALREALEEVRVVADQLRRDVEVEPTKTRREPLSGRDAPITPSRPLERD